MTAVRNVMAIVQKEWRHYFASPIAYAALTIWTLLFGVFFSFSLYYFLRYSVESMRQGMPQPLSLNDFVLAQVLRQMAVVALFLTPILTMRLLAEEKRMGTIELLATSPLTNLQIVLGKYLAALSLYALMVVVSLLNFGLVWAYAETKPEWKPVLTGALGLLLVGACFIALGQFISSLSKNQIVAAMVSFCLFLVIWVLSWWENPTSGTFVQVLSYVGITAHIEDLTKGIIDLKDIVYFLSVITFGLFLTHQSMETQRWRA